LVEVSGVIGRRTGEPNLARRALSALGELADLRLVAMGENMVQGTAQLAGELGLRGADAFYVAVARQLNVPLATLDQDQRERAKENINLKVIDEGGR
jgi:predicted nucleic acid-binding protein